MLIYAWALILAELFKYVKYRITHKGKQAEILIGDNEQPILVLEFNNISQIMLLRLGSVFLFTVFVFGFIAADYAARLDMNRTFFFLSKEQTYNLYFWMYKYSSLGLLIWIWLQGTHFFNKRVVFYRNAVVLENSIWGKRILKLGNNVKLSKQSKVWWLYDSSMGIIIPAFNKKCMRLNHDQEKILKDIFVTIPVKNKLLGF